MKTALLVLLVICAAHATAVQDLAAKMSDFADHPYSKSMVGLVTMNMRTGGPLNELKQLLQQIKDELISLTQLQDAEAATSTRRCQVDSAKLSATLEQAQGDLDNQRQEQSSLNAELATLTARVKDGKPPPPASRPIRPRSQREEQQRRQRPPQRREPGLLHQAPGLQRRHPRLQGSPAALDEPPL